MNPAEQLARAPAAAVEFANILLTQNDAKVGIQTHSSRAASAPSSTIANASTGNESNRQTPRQPLGRGAT